MSQDKSFFVSRTELLAWLNDLLQINYSKVEECASGARAVSLSLSTCCVMSPSHLRSSRHARATRLLRQEEEGARPTAAQRPRRHPYPSRCYGRLLSHRAHRSTLCVQALPTARSWTRSTPVRLPSTPRPGQREAPQGTDSRTVPRCE